MDPSRIVRNALHNVDIRTDAKRPELSLNRSLETAAMAKDLLIPPQKFDLLHSLQAEILKVHIQNRS